MQVHQRGVCVCMSSDQYRVAAFTPLSVVVGRMVRAVHRCLLSVLSSESSAIVITQVLKCLAMVVANVPYQRLRPGLLGAAVKQIRPYLSHRGNGRHPILICSFHLIISHRTDLPLLPLKLSLGPLEFS